MHTLKKGNFRSWFIDGFFPGREEFERFRTVLEERGFYVDVRCPNDYTIADPEWTGNASQPETPLTPQDEPAFPPEGRLDGIYFLLAVPGSFSLTELDSLLTEETRNWPHPLVWLDLAENAGRSPERHLALKERYGL
ncbi:MAG: hypothetical protein LBL69_02090 [Zoogloeaceae bacterium]|nr:hypothetical protein [Zoogloeaceae bacterium]